MTEQDLIVYCANHPQVETTLRCNRCEKPICVKCARKTPTGYKCDDCVRGMQKTFETTHWYDYPLAFLLASVLSFIGGLISTSFIPFLTIFLAPAAGSIIAEVVRKVVQRRRSMRLFRLTAAATILGASPLVIMSLLRVWGSLAGGRMSLWALLPLVWAGLYVFLATSTVFYRLSGIQVRR
jgi:hypothetical protein